MDYKWTFQRFFKRTAENGKEFFEDFTHDVTEIFKAIFISFPRDVYRLVIRIWQYLPILWNDADYDYSAILRMLQYKIHRTRKHMEHHNILTNNKKYCKQMKEVENLIEQIKEDDFCKTEWTQHDLKWGESVSVTFPIPGFSSVGWRSERWKVATNEQRTQERKEFRKLMHLENQRRRFTWKKLTDRLNKNMTFWWD